MVSPDASPRPRLDVAPLGRARSLDPDVLLSKKTEGKFSGWLDEYVLGKHPLMVEIRRIIARVAPYEWPVLITGETGTGKDLAAHAIYAGSRRASKGLHVAAVGGLGETAWSVLFGHRKGSFTGATEDHEGIFSQANGATLLLEDVCDLPLRLQPMLLRALEGGRFRPLGAREERSTHVRVLASTNAPLDRAVEERRFRADLYQRLAVLKIVMPPLRSHLEDLSIYVPHFLKKAVEEGAEPKRVSSDAMNILASMTWPGNVRELEHFLYRATVEVHGPVIRGEDVSRLLLPESEVVRAVRFGRSAPTRETMGMTLKAAKGNKREAARRLGISPTTLYSMMRRWGLS
jgi:two-component system, NtrC family, response regulator HydG